MNYQDFKKIEGSIRGISRFNLEYYNLFYNDFKNKNQSILIFIDEDTFIKLYKNKVVMCEERENEKLLKKYGCAELITICDADIVISTLLYNSNNGINKLHKFNKLKILKENKEV